MSQTFHTPKTRYQFFRHKHAAIGNRYTSSTPDRNVPMKHYNISLSEIGTGSSSSDGNIGKILQSQVSEKRKKTSKKRKVNKKGRVKAQSNDNDNDNEWETESAASITESFRDSRRSTPPKKRDDNSACYNLFEDPCTPEKVRDIAIACEPLYESPIIQSSRKLRLISKKRDDIAQRDDLLPVNLPSAEIRDVHPGSMDEDEVTFHYESRDVKTYPAARKREASSVAKPGKFALRAHFSTESSDLLWDKFVDQFRDEISQYLAPSSARAPVKLTDSDRGIPNVLGKREINPIPPGMVRIQGYSDKASRKWITYVERRNSDREGKHETGGKRKTRTREKRKAGERKEKMVVALQLPPGRETTYDRSDVTDEEFETGGRDGKRLSLREFRCKQKVNKRFALTPSHSDTRD